MNEEEELETLKDEEEGEKKGGSVLGFFAKKGKGTVKQLVTEPSKKLLKKPRKLFNDISFGDFGLSKEKLHLEEEIPTASEISASCTEAYQGACVALVGREDGTLTV